MQISAADEDSSAEADRTSWLLCRAGARLCALPLAQVIETMRVLPAETVTGAPAYVRGLSVIRGAPTLIIDAALLLGGAESPARRLVTVRTGPRIVALAVEAVIGVQAFGAEAAADLPPLLQAQDLIAAIGRLDAELVLLLQAGRIVPDEFFEMEGRA